MVGDEFEEALRIAFADLSTRAPVLSNEDDAPLTRGYYDSSEVPAPARRASAQKYAPDIANRIIEAVRGGAGLREAAQAGGVKVATLNRWRRDSRRADFARELDQARAGGAIASPIEVSIVGEDRVRVGLEGLRARERAVLKQLAKRLLTGVHTGEAIEVSIGPSSRLLA